MLYTVGQSFLFRRYYGWEKEELVVVESLKKGGKAKLSNGWVVDEDGHAEGTGRTPGGYLCPIHLMKEANDTE